MRWMAKYTGLSLALSAGVGTAFAFAAGHSGTLIAIGIAIGMALGVFCWRNELPYLVARRQGSKTKANS
jgi:lipoprotein signal peptidase